jgi:hypothetical protein
VACKKIASISEIGVSRKSRESDEDYEKVIANLAKIGDARRPRNRKALRQQIKTLAGEARGEARVDRIVSRMFSSKVVTQGSSGLTYRI